MKCANCRAPETERTRDVVFLVGLEIESFYCGQCGATWGRTAKPIEPKSTRLPPMVGGHARSNKM